MTEHWCRIVMNHNTKGLVGDLDFRNFVALEISGTVWKDFGFKCWTAGWYPGFDLCDATGLRGRSYDIVLAEQVFEHVKYPFRAASIVRYILKPGGYFLLTVPFLIRHHPSPVDCYRWSAEGLRYFLVETGFDPTSIITGSWGNKDCVIENFKRWAEYDPAIHSLANEEAFPIVCWGRARKAL
jgi:SAM-dependent methyltransferase